MQAFVLIGVRWVVYKLKRWHYYLLGDHIHANFVVSVPMMICLNVLGFTSGMCCMQISATLPTSCCCSSSGCCPSPRCCTRWVCSQRLRGDVTVRLVFRRMGQLTHDHLPCAGDVRLQRRPAGLVHSGLQEQPGIPQPGQGAPCRAACHSGPVAACILGQLHNASCKLTMMVRLECAVSCDADYIAAAALDAGVRAVDAALVPRPQRQAGLRQPQRRRQGTAPLAPIGMKAKSQQAHADAAAPAD